MPINDCFQARGEGQQPVRRDDVDAGPAYSPDDQKRFPENQDLRESPSEGRIRDSVVSTCDVHDPNKEMSSQSEELLHSGASQEFGVIT